MLENITVELSSVRDRGQKERERETQTERTIVQKQQEGEKMISHRAGICRREKYLFYS